MILFQHSKYFGPFPQSYHEIGTDEALRIIATIENTIDQDDELSYPFEFVTDQNILPEDKIFLKKIMKLDPRDRPTAKQLLSDEWFDGVWL